MKKTALIKLKFCAKNKEKKMQEKVALMSYHGIKRLIQKKIVKKLHIYRCSM